MPVSEWVTLINVTENTYHSRQHIINLEGYNWIRIKILDADDTADEQVTAINIDIYDASRGVSDDWIFFGDSITQFAMEHKSLNSTEVYSDLIATATDGKYIPLYENGGIGGTSSSFGAKNIDKWLKIFPGKYVVLSYGTNDNPVKEGSGNFYFNMERMIKAIISEGKVPVIPYIPWNPDSNSYDKNIQLNLEIDSLYATYPQVIRGPDLWTLLKNKPNFFADKIHPNTEGYALIRQAWANTMLSTVYKD